MDQAHLNIIGKFYLVDQIEMEEMFRIMERMSSDIVELTYVVEELTWKCQKLDERVKDLERKQQRDDGNESAIMS